MAERNLKAPIPRQHGAWALLYGSFLIAVGSSPPSIIPMLLVLAAITGAFLAHEPFAKLTRASKHGVAGDLSEHWRKWLGLYLLLCLASGLALTIVFGRWWLPGMGLVVSAFLLLHLHLTAKKRERSLHGELLGTLGLTSTAPVTHYALAGDLSPVSLLLWLLSFLYFASGVFHVKMVVGRFLRPAEFRSKAVQSILYHLLLVFAVTGMAILGWVPVLLPLAYFPSAARSFWGLLRPPGRLNLKRVGYSEVGYTLLFLTCFLLAWHRG